MAALTHLGVYPAWCGNCGISYCPTTSTTGGNMKINVAQIEALASQLKVIAGMLSPQTGALVVGVEALIKLFTAGKEFNGLLQEIMEQNDMTKDAVMAAVIKDYADSSSALHAAIAAKKLRG